MIPEAEIPQGRKGFPFKAVNEVDLAPGDIVATGVVVTSVEVLGPRTAYVEYDLTGYRPNLKQIALGRGDLYVNGVITGARFLVRRP